MNNQSATALLAAADSSDCPADQAPVQREDVLEAALEYRDLGWSIIPILAGAKKPPHWLKWKQYQECRADEHSLRSWFDGKDHGLAVVLGDVSGGLVCRDFDEMGAYERWADDNAELAATLPTVATSRGRHVYFRTAGDSRVKRTHAGEIRGSGGYCVLPPSRHPSGAVYRWLIPPTRTIPQVDAIQAGLAGSGYTESAETAEIADAILGGVSVCDAEPQKTRLCTVRATDIAALAEWPPGTVDAVVGSLPDQEGQRNHRVFDLCRALKAVPDLADCKGLELRPCVEVWHAQALPVIVTQPFETTWADFLHGWKRVKFPKGADPMEGIAARAASEPAPIVAGAYDHPACRFLVALCRELQRTAGNAPFFLSCHKAARLLGVTSRTAWKWFTVLEADAVLSVVGVVRVVREIKRLFQGVLR